MHATIILIFSIIHCGMQYIDACYYSEPVEIQPTAVLPQKSSIFCPLLTTTDCAENNPTVKFIPLGDDKLNFTVNDKKQCYDTVKSKITECDDDSDPNLSSVWRVLKSPINDTYQILMKNDKSDLMKDSLCMTYSKKDGITMESCSLTNDKQQFTIKSKKSNDNGKPNIEIQVQNPKVNSTKKDSTDNDDDEPETEVAVDKLKTGNKALKDDAQDNDKDGKKTSIDDVIGCLKDIKKKSKNFFKKKNDVPKEDSSSSSDEADNKKKDKKNDKPKNKKQKKNSQKMRTEY
ncbi:hypothetical protein EDEG_01860 [Edhazardia aedis USNM 41457]|uniref:Ricin B lectin domain-containing protein n=1 Tax=Edhazardia aedis (strain USNM 41457) TaxID=1003232 RepID=J9D7T4_EDHAE|nr:hypothetical protein EDEG_01860 [Edhazardia aedis USNM 41457]|eukprot:EJW03861.1 hypothetical protein EDEG_01860 [Edhazardia aedis USNM 41457]